MIEENTYWLKADGIPGSEWQRVSKEDWIKAERAAGLRPTMVILVTVTGAHVAAGAESFWTTYAKRSGWPVLNGSGERSHVGSIGMGRRRNGRQWTLRSLGLAPQQWEAA